MKCRNNHESTTTDFCSVCGIEMAPEAESAATAPPASPEKGQETCPVCGSVKTDNFCGECGYNFLTKIGGIVEPPPLQPTVLAASAAPATTSPAPVEAPAQVADAGTAPATASTEKLEVYLTVDTTVEGAPQTPLRIFPLESGDYTIGRPSAVRKIKPAIPADGDDGVSHKHALIREEGEGFAIMDLGSSNGTMLNAVEIIPNTVHKLKKDDVIAIGRWTRLTIHSRAT
jgi:hypothetical protein